MKTTAEADEYLRSPACHKHLVECLKRVEDVATFCRMTRGSGGWYLEIDRYRAWHRVQVGWIHDDTGDFMVEATAYYHKVPVDDYVVTDLGDGLRELRAETGVSWISDIEAGRFGQSIHRRVNQGTTQDLPLVDFADGMVIARINIGAHLLPAAICRVMLGSMRLAKMKV